MLFSKEIKEIFLLQVFNIIALSQIILFLFYLK